MATVTSRVGLRANRDLAQAPVRVSVVGARRVTEVAPTKSNRRRKVRSRRKRKRCQTLGSEGRASHPPVSTRISLTWSAVRYPVIATPSSPCQAAIARRVLLPKVPSDRHCQIKLNCYSLEEEFRLASCLAVW